jgi:hypothetical protein
MSRFDVDSLEVVFDHTDVDASQKALFTRWKGLDGLLNAVECDGVRGIAGSLADVRERVEAFGDNIIPTPEGERWVYPRICLVSSSL